MALFEGIAAVLAKVASASTVAQATAGLGIAVAGVTGAGAAGVLPGPVQDTVAGAVEAVTPFDLPHSTADRPSGDQHATVDHEDHGAVVVPATTVVLPAPAAPTTESAEHGSEAEHAPGTDDGEHQHRGGRAPATEAATTDSSDDSADDSAAPEVEDSESSDDSGHHSGEDSGSGSDSGSDDSSGHGGGDD